jgi:hypothetical protein
MPWNATVLTRATMPNPQIPQPFAPEIAIIMPSRIAIWHRKKNETRTIQEQLRVIAARLWLVLVEQSS